MTLLPLDRTRFQRSLVGAFMLPLFLMALLAGVFLWQVRDLLAVTRWVDHTDQVIAEAHRTQERLLAMESGLRGYLLTGSLSFREPYTRASALVEGELDDLRQLVRDNPSQVQRVEAMRPVVARWRRYAQAAIALRDRGGDYEGYVRTEAGKRQMDDFRTRLHAFVSTEERLRDRRTLAAQMATKRVFLVGSVVALLLGAALAFFSRRQLLGVSESYAQTLQLTRDQAAALQKSEEWFSTTLQSIGDAVIATDARGRVAFINNVAQTLTGWSQEEAAGKELKEVFRIVNEQTRREVESPVARVIESGMIVGLANHTVLIARDGTETPLDDSGAPIRDAQGQITGVVLVFRDITDRKEAEREVAHLHSVAEQRAAELEAVIESMPDAVYFGTAEGMTHCNRAALEMLGVSSLADLRDSIADLGVKFNIRWPDGTPVPTEDLQFMRALRGETVVEEVLARRADTGEDVWVRSSAAPVTIGGHVVGAVAVNADVTALKQAELALYEADRRKDEFLAMLAHELRNPLGAISNALYVLLDRDPTHPAWRRALRVIERQVKHQTYLVDDLLDVSRITRGKIVLHLEDLDLTRLVRQAAEDHRPALEAAGLTLIPEIPEGPVWVKGDPIRLTQVLGNLLQNTTKFTDAGGQVTVRVAADADGTQAAVTVRDTGIGIEPDMLALVFDTFAQADRTLHRSPGGLGLGLALVKGLVELHGGTVSARSEGRGRGAEFTFLLPMGQRAAAPPVPATPASPGVSLGGLRILVVEDNRDAAQTLRDLLELSGYAVEVAHSGSAGVQAAQQFHPDVILCDIGLPGMDGYAVARALRQDSGLASIRLVALSGYGQEEDQRRSHEAGFDLHLTKPVDLDHLKQALAGISAL